MSDPDLPDRPSLPWRIGSTFVIGATGFLTRTFLIGLSKLEVHGWDGFQRVLDERNNVGSRTKGLITVSNHQSVMDDPIVWGALPFSYHWDPNNARWSLASHDIAFKSQATSTFFMLGNTLPAHRQMHSKFGGLFQPTMTQAIRLLSGGPFAHPAHHPLPPSSSQFYSSASDPFTHGALTYTTNGIDSFQSVSSYASRRFSWVHIFPEGRIHQQSDGTMRYFKWGVSRLILEAEPAPDIVPMYIEGFENVMHESRGWPRFLPRAGKSVRITFGEKLDGAVAFGDLRERWQDLKKRVRGREGVVDEQKEELGLLTDEQLRTGREAMDLREECTLRIRHQVLKLRRLRGYPDEDPKCSLADTWREEGMHDHEVDRGKMQDGSWVGDT